MATGNNIEFRVGVIVLLGVAILVVSLYWLQGYRLERNSQLVKVMFDDVGALSIGDRVTVSGVRKGKVKDMVLHDRGVEVELQLYQDVKLSRDAEFTIKNLGLMGERFVAITPGQDSIPFDTSTVATGRYDSGIPEVLGHLGDMIVELRTLVSTLKQTVASDSSLRRFNRTIENLESASSSLSTYLDRNEKRFDETAQNFLSASRELNRLLTTNSSRVDSTLVRVDRTSQNLEVLVARLDTLSISARTFAQKLETEEGTLQLMMEDRRLYDDLRQTADNIDDLIADIRANPRKYINLKVELF